MRRRTLFTIEVRHPGSTVPIRTFTTTPRESGRRYAQLAVATIYAKNNPGARIYMRRRKEAAQ